MVGKGASKIRTGGEALIQPQDSWRSAENARATHGARRRLPAQQLRTPRSRRILVRYFSARGWAIEMDFNSSEVEVNKKIEVRAIVEDLWWGILPIVGMLASAALIATVMRLSTGKW